MAKSIIAAMLVAAFGQFVAPVQSQGTVPAAKRLDVVYVPTPEAVVDVMLRLAKVSKNDVVYDLGTGDGRIPVAAAKKYGARGFGIDIDPERVAEANANVKASGVADKVRIVQGDLFETNLSEATVVTLYLLPSLNQKLIPKMMKELKPGTRVVSHAFDMGDWKPERELVVSGSKIYYWTVPKNWAGVKK